MKFYKKENISSERIIYFNANLAYKCYNVAINKHTLPFSKITIKNETKTSLINVILPLFFLFIRYFRTLMRMIDIMFPMALISST